MTPTPTGSWSGTRRSFPDAIRRACLARDPYCRICRINPSTVADHIHPHAEGGADTLGNAQGLCGPCHDAKTMLERRRGQQRRAIRLTNPQHRPQTHPGTR